MKLFTVVPCIDGKVTADTCASLWRFCRDPGIDLQTHVMMWNQDVVRVRNRAVYEFLRSDATHLWFVDADVGFPPEVPRAMLALGADFVSGAYPKKKIDWRSAGLAARLSDHGEDAEDAQPFEWSFQVHPNGEERGAFKAAELVPMGMTLLSRRLCEAVSAPAVRYGDRYGGHVHQVADVFGLMLIQQEHGASLLPEDYSFTLRARALGFQPWVLLDPICTHTGSYRWDVRQVMRGLTDG